MQVGAAAREDGATEPPTSALPLAMLLAFALVACRLPSSAVAQGVDRDSDTIPEPVLDTGGALAVLTDEERRRVRLEPIVEAPRPSSIQMPLRSTHLRLASEVTASSTCGTGGVGVW